MTASKSSKRKSAADILGDSGLFDGYKEPPNIKPARTLSVESIEVEGKLFHRIPLPVTGGYAEATLVEFNPKALKVSPHNKRLQELLSKEDPSLIRLAKSLKKGQRDPVLVRGTVDEGELIYGSRRRFSASMVDDDMPDGTSFRLKGWLADIPDADVEALADSENDDREDLSIYEKSKLFYQLKENKNMAVDEIAEKYSLDAKTVHKYIQLNEIDIKLIKKLISPHDLTLRAGLKILSELKSLGSERINDFYEKYLNCTFAKANDLLNALLDIGGSKTKEIKDSNFPIVYGLKNDPMAKLSKHRTNQDQYKLDLYGFDEEKLSKVKAFLLDLESHGATKPENSVK